MKIRFAERNDLSEIVKLCKAHAEYEKAKYDSENKSELLSEQLFGNTPSLKCLVVEQKRSIIAYATFMKQFSTWDAAFYIYVDCLYLIENIRGQGIGTQVMDKIREYAKDEHCKMIQWQTPKYNHEAIAFYDKIGGESKAKERFFLKI